MKNQKLYLHSYKATYSHLCIGFMSMKLHKSNQVSAVGV